MSRSIRSTIVIGVYPKLQGKIKVGSVHRVLYSSGIHHSRVVFYYKRGNGKKGSSVNGTYLDYAVIDTVFSAN